MNSNTKLNLNLRSAIRRNKIDSVIELFSSIPALSHQSRDHSNCLSNPLVYAVNWKRPDIVHYLISNQSWRIPPPHASSCLCELCLRLKSDSRFRQVYVQKLLAAIVSPIYVFSLKDDPLDYYLEVFQRIEGVRGLLMKHSKNVYHKLRSTVANNIAALLDACDNEEEVHALLLDGIDPQFAQSFDDFNPALGRLQFFMDLKLRKPLVHKASQLCLNRIWFKELKYYPSSSMFDELKLYLQSLGLYVLSPFIVFMPCTNVLRLIRAHPLAARLETLAIYTNVVVIIVNVAIGVVDINTILCGSRKTASQELLKTLITFILLFGFIIGRMFREAHDIYRIGMRRFYSNIFDIFLSISNAFQLAGLSVLASWSIRALSIRNTDKIASKASSELCPRNAIVSGVEICELDKHLTTDEISYIVEWTSPERIGSALLSIGHLLVFLSLGSAFEWHKTTGVLTHTVTKMLRDIAHFVLLLFLVFLAWSSALMTHYQNFNCASTGFQNSSTTSATLYWGIFAMSDIQAYAITNTPEASGTAVTLMTRVGLILYGSYIVVSSIVAVNLLVAIMSATAEDIQRRKNDSWMFELMRRQMKMILLGKYHKVLLPVPFNLLTPVLHCFRLPFIVFNRFFAKKPRTEENKEIALDSAFSDNLNRLSTSVTRKATVEKCLVKRRLDLKLCEFSRQTIKLGLGSSGHFDTSVDDFELMQEEIEMEEEDDDDDDDDDFDEEE